jgi:hypothetical protein
MRFLQAWLGAVLLIACTGLLFAAEPPIEPKHYSSLR